MVSTLPFSTIVVAGHVRSLGIPGYRPNMALFTLVLTDLKQVLPL